MAVMMVVGMASVDHEKMRIRSKAVCVNEIESATEGG
jgi:hypothetical protein